LNQYSLKSNKIFSFHEKTKAKIPVSPRPAQDKLKIKARARMAGLKDAEDILLG